ncbi:MAG: tyrosine-type recombinase/integrase [Eggerthellaceae bacterium]|nr:tyrosine-type recombinase/integrase [Eggerthellaceae bacterium]
MDIPIKEIAEKILGKMKEENYAEVTLYQYESYFDQIVHACPGGIYSKPRIEQWAAIKASSKNIPYAHFTVLFRKRVARLVINYAEKEIVDLRQVHVLKENPQPVSPNILKSLALFMDHNVAKDLSESQTRRLFTTATTFCLFLEQRYHIKDIDDAPAESIFEFIKTYKGDVRHFVDNLRPYLKFAGRDDLVEAIKLVNAPRNHPIIPTLTAKEQEALAKVCIDGRISLRNASIVLLALTLGLRTIDIISLKLTDIDWRTKAISIIQSKTKNPLTLPLPDYVAETLARYILEERPKTASERVFLTSHAPFRPITNRSGVKVIITRACRLAGIEKTVGTRILRHTAATSMLSSGVDLPVISAVLGHASSDSTGTYLETDASKLKECILSLPFEV